ncbi:MAG: tRNA pseudouridine(13) synthase TruD [Gemmataceae bacterium]|nr:tRNA pseudouridine(13) synthase TruD [Gemmataceae bacterium]
MSDADILHPPLLTADLPGIGGRIKTEPEDFEVEEIPAYVPTGEGEFLYLWIEKRDMGAEYFLRQVARRLDLPNGEVGTAGMKDRRAVTRQWVSVPAVAETNLGKLEGDGLRLLRTSRHANKLRAGHLHGNRFRILLRDVVENAEALLPPIVERLKQIGVPNFYGPQRFGRDGETLTLGLGMLKGTQKPIRNPFLKKLALSAGQSALFNRHLAQRMRDGLLTTVIPGDVMAKTPFGGMFAADDVAAEQARMDRQEIVTAGPIFGRKMFPANGVAAEREAASMEAMGLTRESFGGFGKLMQGTRRHDRVFVADLAVEREEHGLRLSFSLPAGSYATVLLREFTKSEISDDDRIDEA